MTVCRGIGIIHNNMEISQQVQQVRKTKRFENGFITEPFVLKPTDTVYDVDCIKKVGGEKIVSAEKAARPFSSILSVRISIMQALCNTVCRYIAKQQQYL